MTHAEAIRSVMCDRIGTGITINGVTVAAYKSSHNPTAIGGVEIWSEREPDNVVQIHRADMADVVAILQAVLEEA